MKPTNIINFANLNSIINRIEQYYLTDKNQCYNYINNTLNISDDIQQIIVLMNSNKIEHNPYFFIALNYVKNKVIYETNDTISINNILTLQLDDKPKKHNLFKFIKH